LLFGRPTLRQSLDEILTSAADAGAIAHAYREHGYSMRAIASHLGCGSTPSIAASAVRSDSG
jgi:hypothetical protein